VPAVALASQLGVPKLLRFLSRAGLSTFDRTASYYGLGLTLGNAEVRLDELVSAYAAFARGGEWLEPTPLSAAPGRTSRRIVSERTAFWITDILSDDEAREYVFGRGGSLEFPFAVAVKTGTSQAYHDNWTVGYSRQVTVGVWVGNFDRTPLRNSSGVTGAAPIFQAVMLAADRAARGGLAHAGSGAILDPPAGAEERDVCALSGLLANAWCPTRKREWVGDEMTRLPCSWHHRDEDRLLTILPAEYDGWRARVDGQRADVPRAEVRRADVRRAEVTRADVRRTDGLAIVSPADGSTYLIDPTLRREFQTVPLKAIGAAPGTVVWTVDGRSMAPTSAGLGVEWPLAAGRHRIAARDAVGRTAEIEITVR
jgi:penicillin-binding protein 1C